MVLTDWEYLWRQEGDRNDSLKIKALLAKYLEEEPTGFLSLLGTYSWPIGYERGPEIKKAFNKLFPNTTVQKSVTVEQIIAEIKSELYGSYPYKIHVTKKHYHELPSQKMDEIYIVSRYETIHPTYFIRLPSGKIAQGFVNLTQDFKKGIVDLIDDDRSALINALLYNKHALSLPIDNDELSKIFSIIKRKTGVDYNELDHNEVIRRYKQLGTKKTVNKTWSKQTNNDSNSSLDSKQFYSKSELDPKGLRTIKLSFYKDGQSAIQITTSTEEYPHFSMLAQNNALPTETPIKLHGYMLEENNALLTRTLIDLHGNNDEVSANSYYFRQRQVMFSNYYEYLFFYVDAQKNIIQLPTLKWWEVKNISRFFHPQKGYWGLSSLTDDIIENMRKHLDGHLPTAINDAHQNKYTIYIPQEGTALTSQFLTILEEFDPSAEDIINEIRDVLEIKKNDILSEKFLELGVQASIDKAIKLQNIYENEHIWTLANKYYEEFRLVDSAYIVTRQQLYDIFNGISNTNKYYAKAQEVLVELFIGQSKLEQDNIEPLEQAFLHAINSGNQDLIDDVFDRLCGFSGKKIEINTIQPNVATLLKLATCIRGLHTKPSYAGTFFASEPEVVNPKTNAPDYRSDFSK